VSSAFVFLSIYFLTKFDDFPPLYNALYDNMNFQSDFVWFLPFPRYEEVNIQNFNF